MNYYILGIPFSDELYHHGIRDQRWGYRRFQYKNGKLTDEGFLRYYGHPRGENKKENDRYGSDKEKRKIANDLINHRDNKVIDSHIIKNTLSDIKESSDNLKRLAKEEIKLKNDFENDKVLYNKYFEQAVDEAIQRNWYPKKYTKDEIKNFYGDDFREYTLELFKLSGDKRAKLLVDAENRFSNARGEHFALCRKYADLIAGKYGNKTISYLNGISRIPVRKRLEGILITESSKHMYDDILE